jgi:hypothetical protein
MAASVVPRVAEHDPALAAELQSRIDAYELDLVLDLLEQSADR